MCTAIDAARSAGESLGGVIAIAATGLPPGLGSYAERARGLDAGLAGALMSIPAIKGVEIGDGFTAAEPSRLGGPRSDRARGRRLSSAVVESRGRRRGRHEQR